jgi:hypothetical protein
VKSLDCQFLQTLSNIAKNEDPELILATDQHGGTAPNGDRIKHAKTGEEFEACLEIWMCWIMGAAM